MLLTVVTSPGRPSANLVTVQPALLVRQVKHLFHDAVGLECHVPFFHRPAVEREPQRGFVAQEAALADADGHRDALLDERQLLRLFEAYLDVVGDGRPADGLRVDRRGRGLGLLGGVAQPLDPPRVVDAVAQQQHRLALRPVVFQAVLDGRRQVGGGAVGLMLQEVFGGCGRGNVGERADADFVTAAQLAPTVRANWAAAW